MGQASVWAAWPKQPSTRWQLYATEHDVWDEQGEGQIMLDAVWDMETNDPDDFLTLLFLLGHPQANLRAVTLFPGTPQQVGLVRRAVNNWFGRDIPIGAYQLQRETRAVSPWHLDAYGPVAPSLDARPGGEVLLEQCTEDMTLITGAPLKNLGAAMQLEASNGRRLRLREAVIQGGFAGEGIVPRERQLPKFAGRVTCGSFNLNGDPRTALEVQKHSGIHLRRFVSKNVCHGVIYDRTLHVLVAERKERSLGLQYIWQGMEHYLKRRPEGKIIHDLVAACCAIDSDIATWAEVELYRERGEWGARLAPGSGTWIIVDYDHARFLAILLQE
jgi:inosine-uridine nucleoside N-ribohydrolase